MLHMRKWQKLALPLLAALLLFGCAPVEQPPQGFSVVAAAFPEYDWTRQILGDDPDGVRLTLLLDGGVDMHSYQPTAADMLAVADCDLFIYGGGVSEKWLDDALSGQTAQPRRALSLLDALPEESLLWDEDGDAPDEHFWLSLSLAASSVQAICDELCTLDPAGAAAYQKNAAAYIAELNELKDEYLAAVAAAPRRSVLVADRFPFRYLAAELGLDYLAAFSGCSAETEASFAVLSGLIDALREQGFPAVLVLENSDRRLAEAVVRDSGRTDVPVLELNSMQAVTAADAAAGVTYLELARQNLAVLLAALN